MKRVLSSALAAAFSLIALSVATKAGATITVPTQQPTVQDAINAALPGEQIIVLPGSYNEGTINVTKSVSIEGPNIGIGPSGTRGPEARIIGGFVILADNVSIQGLQVVVWVPDAFPTRRAIHAPQAVAAIEIAFNWILSPSAAPNTFNVAIELGDPTGASRSSDLRIRGNTIFGDVPGVVQGMQLQSVDRAYVSDNKIVLQTTPGFGGDFGWPGIYLETCSDSRIAKNEIDCGQTNANISSLAYGIGLASMYAASVNVLVQGNNITRAVAGMLSHSSDFAIRQLTIKGNIFEGHYYGISLQGSTLIPNSVSHEQIDISNNEIKIGLTGILLSAGPPIQNSQFINVEAHHNCFEPLAGYTTVFGVGVTTPVVIPSYGGVVDARGNYWNAPDGPSTVGPGSGVRVSNRVDFSKWRERCSQGEG